MSQCGLINAIKTFLLVSNELAAPVFLDIKFLDLTTESLVVHVYMYILKHLIAIHQEANIHVYWY